MSNPVQLGSGIECPRCRIVGNVTETTIGGLWKPEDDPNTATCRNCGRTGRSGDWYLIRQLRNYVAKALDMTEQT